MKLKIFVAAISLGICLLNLQCVFPSKVAGNGSQAPNSAVVGMIYQPGGKGPARGDTVVIRSGNYLADIQKLSKRSATDSLFTRGTRTDDSGCFRFDSIPLGKYCIEAHDSGSNRVFVEVASSLFQSDMIKLPSDTLKAAAIINGKILSGYASSGSFVRVFGLDAGAKVGPDSTFLLKNLPEGNLQLLVSIINNDNTPFDTVVNANLKAGSEIFVSITIINDAVGKVITFQKSFINTGIYSGKSVQQTDDGGYLVAGDNAIGSDASNIYLLKCDETGILSWIKEFDFSNHDRCNSAQQTSDGGYAIIGSATNYSAIADDSIILIKTNSVGTVIWKKMFNGVTTIWGKPLQQTRDGGYIIVGSSSTPYHESDSTFLLKTDAAGTTTWQKTFSSTDLGVNQSVRQTLEGGYIITGILTNPGGVGDIIYLIKTDTAGTTQWKKTFGTVVSDVSNSIMQTRDGGYIITGSTSSIGGVNGDVFLIKIDSVGTETWSKTFGGDGFDAGFSVQQTRDGGYIVAGLIHLFNPSSSGVYLIKTDASGATVWTKTFGGALSYEGYSVQQTTDGGYIVTGYIQPLSSSDVGAFLIKTDENGDVK